MVLDYNKLVLYKILVILINLPPNSLRIITQSSKNSQSEKVILTPNLSNSFTFCVKSSLIGSLYFRLVSSKTSVEFHLVGESSEIRFNGKCSERQLASKISRI
jgi:hypothetical protein